MILLVSLLAFYLAWNLGANDVANSMGTSVGSKAVTLRQALVIAGILEFTGAICFGQQVSETLAIQVVDPAPFGAMPEVLLLGMGTVLLASGIWLNVATGFGWPVSSSHAVVGAIAGFGWVAGGVEAVDWHSLQGIALTWMVTPLVSGGLAALGYRGMQFWILDQPHPLQQLQEWIPWLSALLLSVFGVLVLPSLSLNLQTWLFPDLVLPTHSLALGLGAIALVMLTGSSWQRLTQVRSQVGLSPQNLTEQIMAHFQVLSACFVAFAHGSNDVGNAIAPLAVIVQIQQTGAVPTDHLHLPLWMLVLGGTGIVAGLAVWGHQVITTIGEQITPRPAQCGFLCRIGNSGDGAVGFTPGSPRFYVPCPRRCSCRHWVDSKLGATITPRNSVTDVKGNSPRLVADHSYGCCPSR